MNSYHKNHPDPDIRRKYQEWLTASRHCAAIGSGHSSADAHTEALRKVKEQRKTASVILASLGGQSVKGSKFGGKVTAKQARKHSRAMQRTGGQRGS